MGRRGSSGVNRRVFRTALRGTHPTLFGGEVFGSGWPRGLKSAALCWVSITFLRLVLGSAKVFDVSSAAFGGAVGEGFEEFLANVVGHGGIFVEIGIPLGFVGDGGEHFLVGDVVDVDSVVGLGSVIHETDGDGVGFEAFVFFQFGEVKSPASGADGVDGDEGGGVVIGFVPAFEFVSGVDAEEGVGLVSADFAGDLFGQFLGVDVFEHAVVVSEPGDVFLGDAEDGAGFFLFGFADFGEARGGHGGVIGAFVVVGVDDDDDFVSVGGESRHGAAAAEGVVVGMGGDDHDGFASPGFDSIVDLGEGLGGAAVEYAGGGGRRTTD